MSADSWRLLTFGGVLALMFAWEWLRPHRSGRSTSRRWVNLTLMLIDTALLRLTLPVLAVGVAWQAQAQNTGFFNRVELPGWLEFGAALVILDLLIYWQHRLFHRWPWLWRLHAMHHSDTAIDVTTGVRFHPLEILLSMLIKMAAVWVIGASPLAVVVFEIALNAASLFNHGNVVLPRRWEPYLRRLMVTPEMHRIHHSPEPDEHHRNFGFTVSWWDRCFGSYCARARLGDEQVEAGLDAFRETSRQSLWSLLTQPFSRGPFPR
ncbi:sterol desaturase/sphingolipid hydroxylase (fatty acid hydroxylase superfamily) [Litorivivens lipolytica]|uniref:Sterol desaturase/sphingolipid hydroxylase (Fatty acid hydroxylase superfamily) n=1 Tax=Litorivivens lipolytica TaxID=1524264 RepID=A0A7W4Z492_9GAMM|nr:sterol desaturase family protein [Litorivivens lipolytica]MBB3045797.1 sterol desaturase/sphingolipid hydroxylase (fatty acid hydroxylase superfamily) [Litorivivens lipolytica]